MNGDLTQTNLSENIRLDVKRRAARNGGTKGIAQRVGLPYKRIWEQLNRTSRVSVDIIPPLFHAGETRPLRMIADACGQYVIPKTRFLRKRDTKPPVRADAIDMLDAAVGVAKEISDALLDQQFDSKESVLVQDAFAKLDEHIAVLRFRVSALEGKAK
jgi:hypothetical protein